MGKFSYDDYMNLKKKGLVSWDDDLIKGHSKNLNDFVKGTSSLTEESFDDNVSKLRELEDQHRYVQTYINSLEGSENYNGAKRSFDSIDATLNKAKGFYGQFKDSKAYGEALKQQKEAQAAEKQAKAQADEYRYNSKYQDFSYDELTRASKSTAPNLDESERNWLKKAAQNKATAQEYYEKELAPIEARMKELDEQYMQTHYSTPEMQNEYAKLRKQLDEKENIYKQKKDNQAAVNNAVEKREESARLNANLSRKYLTPATGGMSDEQAAKENESYLNRLIEGFYNSNDDKEREWIKERIKSGGFGSKAVEKAMNELYERSDDEAKRISGEYVYDGYETKKKDIIQSSQKKYADAAYMLENVLHPIKRAETSSKYMSLSGNKDFEANSNPDMIAGFTKREDRGELDNKRYMTDDEYKVYTYVYNTQGPEKAEEFFKSIEPELNKKMTEAQAQKEADLANSGLGGAIAASVKSLGYNFISGGGFIEDVVNYAAHKEVDTNSFLNLPANLSNAARQTVQKNIDNPVGQWIYGTTMSIADNAINMLVSKGIGKVAGLAGASASTVNNVAANATSIIMGSQVATQTVIDCKDKGLSDGQALGLGLIHGLVEHITEKVSIENILSDPRTFKQALKKSFVSEGSEEVAANWLDRAADALIMGDKSKERQDFENFKAQGMSDIEAFGQVMLGCLGEDAEAFLAGGVSGIVMSGVSHGFDKVTKGIVKGNEFNKIAEEASKKTDFDERKKELIKEAKESGDKKAVKMAESFERTIERHNGDLSAIKVGDVANIMRVLDDARQNAIESGNEAAAEQQSTVDSIIESSARTMERSKIANKSFNDIGLGAVKGKRVNLNAFGASHPKGIRVTQNSNPSISHDIVRIESSAKEYGEKENTVVLKTSDGRYINADEVTMPTKTYDTLIREAKNYDTNGARGLLANYEGYADYCKRSGKEADVKEYIQQYDALYDLGRHGVRAESMRTGGSARFNSIADAIGIEQAENALNTGANDADAVFMHENNVMLKMRMPGQKHAADSKVVIDVSEGEELNISDDQKNILQAIAQKTGRTIVLTDKLSENVNGTFAPDGRIYINSKIENSNYGVAVALHEAIHGLRTAAPMEYNALKKFIVNYLVEQGENIDDLLDDIAMRWGDSAASEEARLEELVAQSVMALATDDAALKKAIECEENKKLLNKVLDAIKSIAEKVREFIKGTLKDGKITGAHNKQAQFWTENLKALDELAEKFSKAMDVQRVNVREYGQKNNTSGEVRYSFAGESAQTADKSALETAKEMEKGGKAVEYIRRETGWHKGYDGKWRFEIDDSKMKLNDMIFTAGTLGDLIEHDKLFDAYPQLKSMRFEFDDLQPGVNAYLTTDNRGIMLDRTLRLDASRGDTKRLKKTLIHEIQHAIQRIEGFAGGTNPQAEIRKQEKKLLDKYIRMWEKAEEQIKDKDLTAIAREFFEKYEQMVREDPNLLQGFMTKADKLFDDYLEKFAEKTDSEEYVDLFYNTYLAYNEYAKFKYNTYGSRSDYGLDAYNRSAGEIEARDTADRLEYSEDARYYSSPDISRDDVVVSGEKSESFEIKYPENALAVKYKEKINEDRRYSKDDTIYDDLFDTDGDLFEPENKEYLDKFIKTSPDEATLSMYNSLSKTGESVIKEFKGIKLSDENYRKAARRLMKDYDIKLKLNPGTDVELADRIKNFVLWFEKNPNANYNEALNVLADDCKGFLLLSGDYVDSFKEERQDLLSRLKGRTLVLRSYEEDQILENFGGIKGLRRAFFGKANVGYEKNAKGKPKVYIEDLVEEFSEQWGKNWASEDDIDSFAGWAWLDNMLNNVLKPKFVNPYTDGEMSLYRSIDAVAVEMAMQITDELVKEKADAAAKSKSADKKLITELRKKERAAHSAKEALEKSKREKYKKLADEEKRKRIEMSEHYSDKYKDSERKRIEQNERFRERIREVEGKNKEYRRIIFDSEKSIRERYIEAREKTRYRKLLAKEFERMTKRLDGKAKNNEYIPEKLKKPIKEFLSLFEILPEKGKLPSYWGEYRRISDIGAKIDELASEYEKLGSTGKTETHFGMTFNADTVGYDESIKNELRELAGQIRNKNVYALTAEELKAVYEGMRVLDQSLRKAVEIIVDEKRENINELARKAVEETQGINFKKGNSVTQIKDYALATHLDPVRYGRFLSGYHDDYVIAKLFRDLHEGDKNQVRIMYRAFVELERTLDSEFSENERKNLQTKDIESFDFTDTETGKRVKISDAMLLSIYLTDRQADGHRQLTNDKANHYTRLPDLDTANRENVAVVGKTAASLTKSNEKAVGEKSHRVRFTEADLRQIREYIENDRKLYKLAEAVSSVFNGIIKDEINKVSLQREGRMIATVKNYFPLATDKEYPGKKFEVEIGESLKDLRLKSRAFTKQRSYAYNALMIDDVFKVFLKHVQETAEYCGMIIPVENFKRVFGKGNDNIVLSEAIKQKFGSAATHYISKLMDDIQAPKNKLDENIITRLHGNYMGAVLMINPGAVIKQFAAFPTAFKYFGVSNVTKAVPVSLAKGKSLVEKYSEYTPYMWYRENGNGTIIAETSRQLSLTGKAESWLDIMGKADRFVVNCLLYAAEEHVRQTRSDLEFDSDEFKKEVARQFERAVDESQPNNMVTSKPQFVRNQALRMLSMNAFISQNMAMGNGIIDSGMEFAARLSDYKANKNAENAEAAKKAAKGFASHIVGTLLSSGLLKALEILAALFFYHKWDDTKDEEGKTSWNKICEQWLSGIGENFAGAFAQGDTIYRIMTGKWENLEVMSLSAINDIAKSVKSGDIVKAWGRIADALGLPLVLGNNIQRNVRGLWLTASDLFNGSYPIGGGHSIYKNNGELDTQFFGDFIVDYMKNGNKEEADKYVKLWQNELVSSGKSENEAMSIIKNKIAAVLTQTDSDVTDAFVAHMNGDTTKYKKLFDKLEGYGFDPSDIDKAIDGVKSDIFAAMKKSGVEKADAKDDLMGQGFSEEAANKLSEEYLKPAKEQKDSAFDDTSEGKKVKFSNKDGLTALKNGDKKTYEQIREYIVESDSNVENNEAFDKMMRSLTYTGDIVDGYLEAMDNKNEAEREKYKKQLINIYGSWDDAGKVVLKRDKNKRKKK